MPHLFNHSQTKKTGPPKQKRPKYSFIISETGVLLRNQLQHLTCISPFSPSCHSFAFIAHLSLFIFFLAHTLSFTFMIFNQIMQGFFMLIFQIFRKLKDTIF